MPKFKFTVELELRAEPENIETLTSRIQAAVESVDHPEQCEKIEVNAIEHNTKVTTPSGYRFTHNADIHETAKFLYQAIEVQENGNGLAEQGLSPCARYCLSQMTQMDYYLEEHIAGEPTIITGRSID